MRYLRVLSVLALMTAVGLAAVALARGSQGPHPPASLRRAVEHEAQQLARTLFPGRTTRIPRAIVIPAPELGGTTCFVGTSCAIRPCVIPVANPVTAVVAVPGAVTAVAPVPGAVTVVRVPNPVTRCPLGDRVPKSFRVVEAR